MPYIDIPILTVQGNILSAGAVKGDLELADVPNTFPGAKGNIVPGDIHDRVAPVGIIVNGAPGFDIHIAGAGVYFGY
jgi:hypothetical protein